MDRSSERRFNTVIISVVILGLIVLILMGVNGYWNLPAIGFYSVFSILLLFLITRNAAARKEKLIELNKVLGKDANEAFKHGNIGMLTYNDNFEITWMSDFFLDRNINFIGEKVTKWLPEVNRIFQGTEDEILVEYKEKGQFYQVIRKSDSQILFFLDVTEKHKLEESYENEKVVLGLIHLDNYDEATQYEEETRISIIDAEIKQPIIDWAMKHNMLIKRVKNDRFLLALNEEIFNKLMEENFTIMQEVRRASAEYPIPITLSMAFARGTADYRRLDSMLNDLMELAQSRGGDQIAVKKFGEDVRYIGGNSEAKEKRSKVRVRVISQTLRELIQQSRNVIIVGHKEADFDCMASALAVSRIVATYRKPVCIVTDPDDLEHKLSLAMRKYNDKLVHRHDFVTEEQALRLLEKKTLVIMVDHHDLQQCNAAQIVAEAKRVVVIDHHRRKGDFEFVPLMVYLEASASSVSELVTELLPYQLSRVDISEEEATILYTGIYVDTTGFKARTGSRTFEAAAELKKLGADPQESFDFLKEDFDEFEIKTNVLKNAERYPNGIVIATYDGERKLTRALISQVANSLLGIQDVEASFVISNLNDDTVAMSARSIGNINVQLILEKMHGGGHFSQAGLQRSNVTVESIKKELLDNIKLYFEEKEAQNESNPAE